MSNVAVSISSRTAPSAGTTVRLWALGSRLRNDRTFQPVARTSRRHLSVVQHDLAVDDDVCDADRRLRRVAGYAAILNSIRIEDGDVGLLAQRNHSAIDHAE